MSGYRFTPLESMRAGNLRGFGFRILFNEMDRATEGSFETGSAAAENAREVSRQWPDDGSVSHAGAGESPATVSHSSVPSQAPSADEKAVPPFNKRGTASSHGQD